MLPKQGSVLFQLSERRIFRKGQVVSLNDEEFENIETPIKGKEEKQGGHATGSEIIAKVLLIFLHVSTTNA